MSPVFDSQFFTSECSLQTNQLNRLYIMTYAMHVHKHTDCLLELFLINTGADSGEVTGTGPQLKGDKGLGPHENYSEKIVNMCSNFNIK